MDKNKVTTLDVPTSGVPQQVVLSLAPDLSKLVLAVFNFPLRELHSRRTQHSFCLKRQKSNVVSLIQMRDFLT